jgi:hypothetical protein
MHLGILSDTHDQLPRTQAALALLRSAGADVLIHCGDITRPNIVTACAVLPLYFAYGNNDADSVPELTQVAQQTGATCLGWGDVVELAGKKIGVTHGHMTTDLRRVLALHPDYLLTGHSHRRHDYQEGRVRRINPGALYRASEFTVAVLHLETAELRFLPVPR